MYTSKISAPWVLSRNGWFLWEVSHSLLIYICKYNTYIYIFFTECRDYDIHTYILIAGVTDRTRADRQTEKATSTHLAVLIRNICMYTLWSSSRLFLHSTYPCSESLKGYFSVLPLQKVVHIRTRIFSEHSLLWQIIYNIVWSCL